MDTQLDIGSLSWGLLPSPKITKRDRTGVAAWTKLYSGFSADFALSALRLIRSSEQEVVIDPFCGAGTTLVAATKEGHPAIGVDLDPFSALLSRAAVAAKAEPSKVAALLAEGSPADCPESNEEARDLFNEEDLRYAGGLFKRLQEATCAGGVDLIRRLFDDPSGAWDSEVVAVAALGVGANYSANIVRGSNPVWYRRPVANELTQTREPLASAARRAAEVIIKDLVQLPRLPLGRGVRVFNEDFRTFNQCDKCADLILTSPPYLNRLDYVVNHLAPLSLLGMLMPVDMESLRRKMVGTTKLVDKGISPDSSWGATCLSVLDQIETHPSKASKTYYYWNYHKYFGDLFVCLRNLRNVCRGGARGLIVVQNSYYKTVAVPVPEILVEMGVALNLDMAIVRREKVRAHLGIISPQQMNYVPRKILEEVVIFVTLP